MIANLLGISVDCLLLRFREDLNLGMAIAADQVASAFFQKCLDGDVSCMIFYLKTRLGWRDVSTVEHSIKGSDKIRDVVRDLYGISLSDDPSPEETRKAAKTIERKHAAETTRH